MHPKHQTMLWMTVCGSVADALSYRIYGRCADVGDLDERVAVVDELIKNGKITFLQDYTARKKKEDVRYERRKDADLAL